MQDTFYINENVVMRTHTSPVQARAMLSRKPPIRMICPGRVFRSDDVDATHSPVFHQVEGLVIDKNITFGQLKGILDDFMKRFFGPHTQTRFRPGYFPFTEPARKWTRRAPPAAARGCRVCKGTGWIEVLAAAWCTPTCCAMAASIPKCTPASPLALASTGLPTSSTTSRTSVCCSKATRGFWLQF